MESTSVNTSRIWFARIIAMLIGAYFFAIIGYFAAGPYSIDPGGISVSMDDYVKPISILALFVIVLWFTIPQDRRLSFFSCFKSPPLIAALITIFLVSGAVKIYLTWHNAPVGHLILAGERFLGDGIPDPAVPVIPDSFGYDGQFFYRLSIEPFAFYVSRPPALDMPAYRQQRIVYPLTVYALSGGDIRAVPLLLVLVNIFCLGLLSWAGAKLAMEAGREPWWGLVFGTYAGFLISVFRDLAEPMSMMFVIMALLGIREKKYALAAISLALGVLTRETTLIVGGAIGIVWIVHRVMEIAGHKADKEGSYDIPLYVPAAPAIAFAVMQAYLHNKYGIFSSQHGVGNFATPFLGLWGQLRDYYLGANAHYRILDLLLLAGLLLAGFSALINTLNRRVMWHERLMFAIYASMGACYGWSIMQAREGFMRALSEYYTISWVLIIVAGSRMGIPLAILWAALFVGMIVYNLPLGL